MIGSLQECRGYELPLGLFACVGRFNTEVHAFSVIFGLFPCTLQTLVPCWLPHVDFDWRLLILSQCRIDTSFLVSFLGVSLPLTVFHFSCASHLSWLTRVHPFTFCATTCRIENAEVLCLGIVSVAVFMLVLPLFKATGNILLQIAPSNVPPSAFTKCSRQVNNASGSRSFGSKENALKTHE